MRIIIIGPPGTGKETQSKFISKLLKIRHISSGDLIRKKAKTNPFIKRLINKGNLLPDKIVINIVKKELKRKNFVLDGFPRTLVQAGVIKFKPNLVIFLNTNKNKCVERLLLRRRIDDNIKSIKRRYRLFLKKTVPVINYYKKMNYFHEINGNLPKKNVSNKIKNILNNSFGNH
jgi:adenylate kinase